MARKKHEHNLRLRARLLVLAEAKILGQAQKGRSKQQIPTNLPSHKQTGPRKRQPHKQQADASNVSAAPKQKRGAKKEICFCQVYKADHDTR
jgi:hypothetical protein